MKIWGVKENGKKVLVATGKRAEELAASIGLRGTISKKLFAGMVLVWEDENGRTSEHLLSR